MFPRFSLAYLCLGIMFSTVSSGNAALVFQPAQKIDEIFEMRAVWETDVPVLSGPQQDSDTQPYDNWLVQIGITITDPSLSPPAVHAFTDSLPFGVNPGVRHLTNPHPPFELMGGSLVNLMVDASFSAAEVSQVVSHSGIGDTDIWTLAVTANDAQPLPGLRITLTASHVPEPTAFAVWSLLGLSIAGACWWQRRIVAL